MCYKFGTFLRHPRQNNKVKWPNSRFCEEREHMTANVYSLSQLELFQDSSAALYKLNEFVKPRSSVSNENIYFQVTF